MNVNIEDILHRELGTPTRYGILAACYEGISIQSKYFDVSLYPSRTIKLSFPFGKFLLGSLFLFRFTAFPFGLCFHSVPFIDFLLCILEDLFLLETDRRLGAANLTELFLFFGGIDLIIFN